jgi:hypothetical protein
LICAFNIFVIFLLLLDCLQEQLFRAKERIMELSFGHDVLNDAVFGLEKELYDSLLKYRKLQKKFHALEKLHSECKNRSLILYR